MNRHCRRTMRTGVHSVFMQSSILPANCQPAIPDVAQPLPRHLLRLILVLLLLIDELKRQTYLPPNTARPSSPHPEPSLRFTEEQKPSFTQTHNLQTTQHNTHHTHDLQTTHTKHSPLPVSTHLGTAPPWSCPQAAAAYRQQGMSGCGTCARTGLGIHPDPDLPCASYSHGT